MKTLQNYILEAKATPEHQAVLDNVYTKIEDSLKGSDIKIMKDISGSGKQSYFSVNFMDKYSDGFHTDIKIYLMYEKIGLILTGMTLSLKQGETSIWFETDIQRLCPNWKPSFDCTPKKNKGYIISPENYDDLIEAILDFNDVRKDISKILTTIIDNKDEYRDKIELEVMNTYAKKFASKEEFLEEVPRHTDAYQRSVGVSLTKYIEKIVGEKLQKISKKIL